MHKVVVLDDYHDQFESLVDWTSLGPDVHVSFVHDHVVGEDLRRAIADAEVVVAVRERTALGQPLLTQITTLRHIATTGRANAAIDIASANALGITVSGTGGHVPAVLELIWALIFDVTKHVTREDRALRAGSWQETLSGDLAGTTLGILGLGRLGSAMVPIARLFDMHVIAWSQHIDHSHAASLGVEVVTMDGLLERSDVLSIQVRLSERTRSLLGASELAKMKKTAYLVNTARGPIVDERALINALSTGQIAGAALDVFDVEPLGGEHPFFVLDNVVLTPHLGYASKNQLSSWFGEVLQNIAAYLHGDAIPVVLSP